MNTLPWFCHIVRSIGTLQSQCCLLKGCKGYIVLEHLKQCANYSDYKLWNNSPHILLRFSACLFSLSLSHTMHPLILISQCPTSWLQGYPGNDSPSDVFMSGSEPSVSLQCCEKVADTPLLCLMDGACLLSPASFICWGRPIPLDPPIIS